jgi:hypothetical protein
MGADARTLPRNCASAACSGMCSLGCRTGHKRGADTTYLADAAALGARVLTGARAARVLLGPSGRAGNGGGGGGGGGRGGGVWRARRAVGVEIEVGGEEEGGGGGGGGGGFRLAVRAPVVVASAGSLHTVGRPRGGGAGRGGQGEGGARDGWRRGPLRRRWAALQRPPRPAAARPSRTPTCALPARGPAAAPPPPRAPRRPGPPSPQPALLLRSGVSCGGNVGAHLRLHPAFGVIGRFGAARRRFYGAERGAVDPYKARARALFAHFFAFLCSSPVAVLRARRSPGRTTTSKKDGAGPEPCSPTAQADPEPGKPLNKT